MNDGMRMGSRLTISVVRPGGTIHRGWWEETDPLTDHQGRSQLGSGGQDHM